MEVEALDKAGSRVTSIGGSGNWDGREAIYSSSSVAALAVRCTQALWHSDSGV